MALISIVVLVTKSNIILLSPVTHQEIHHLYSLVAKRGHVHPLDKLTGPTFSDSEFYVENEF